MEQGDLTELLGNLMDNGRKWAASRVRLRFEDGAITIEDDGPGVPDAELERIRERGRRLDETKQGSGLGLSIVEDIADIYGLQLTYGRSELGGLKVEHPALTCISRRILLKPARSSRLACKGHAMAA